MKWLPALWKRDTEGIEAAKEQAAKADQVSETLRRIRDENHFGEAFQFTAFEVKGRHRRPRGSHT